jgi:hypothetical protein
VNLGVSSRIVKDNKKHKNAIEAFNKINPLQLPVAKSYKNTRQSETKITFPN